MAFEKLATRDELPPGALIEVLHGGGSYALCHVGGQIRAMSGICPHQGGPLGQGTLNDGMVTCPWHAWDFDPANGVCAFDDDIRVPVFTVRAEAQDVLVDLPEGEARHDA